MENERIQDSGAWRIQVMIAFAVSLGFTTVGIGYLPLDQWSKGYLMMGLYFTVSSAFTLAKTLRDAHESQKFTSRLTEAKTEKMLREYSQT